jgi:tRNA(fMet)-specific endonuclease VapC
VTRYLLDTNVVSDLVRRPTGEVAARVMEVGEAAVCTSIIVAAELRYGAAKKGSQRLTSQLEAVLGALQIMPWEEPADEHYARLRAELERAGRPIGGNGMLIAAHALALRLVLVRDNEREYGRVEGLAIENWLR